MRTENLQEKVSIIIPVYNAEKTLAACLDSVMAQDYPNTEVILIDDGSTDSSGKICMSYKETYGSRIRYMYQSNSGPAAARNKGLDECDGTYIVFIDSDDSVSPVMISTMMAAATEHQADMVICGYWLIEQEERTACSYELPDGMYGEDQVERVLLSVLKEDDRSVPPYSWVRLTKKSVFDGAGLRFQNGLIRSEDFHFWTKVHACLRSVYLLGSMPLYNYIQNPQSITHRYIKGYWQGVQFIYDDLMQMFPDTQTTREQLGIMLVKRSLISLNNAVMCPSMRQAWRDIRTIVTDKRLNREIKAQNKTPTKKFRSYRRLMGHHGQILVSFKYLLEWIKRHKGRNKG